MGKWVLILLVVFTSNIQLNFSFSNQQQHWGRRLAKANWRTISPQAVLIQQQQRRMMKQLALDRLRLAKALLEKQQQRKEKEGEKEEGNGQVLSFSISDLKQQNATITAPASIKITVPILVDKIKLHSNQLNDNLPNANVEQQQRNGFVSRHLDKGEYITDKYGIRRLVYRCEGKAFYIPSLAVLKKTRCCGNRPYHVDQKMCISESNMKKSASPKFPPSKTSLTSLTSQNDLKNIDDENQVKNGGAIWLRCPGNMPHFKTDFKTASKMMCCGAYFISIEPNDDVTNMCQGKPSILLYVIKVN